MIRKIIHIDEEKCNGCGLCARACHESAIGIIDGKAKLLREDYCDGLGDCLPACPTNAISFIEKEAAAYNEAAVLENKKKLEAHSQLQQWPVQIKLVPINAPYFDDADLLIAADCTAYAYANFHQDFIKGKITLIGCPKLDSVDYSEKLTEIILREAYNQECSNDNINRDTIRAVERPVEFLHAIIMQLSFFVANQCHLIVPRVNSLNRAFHLFLERFQRTVNVDHFRVMLWANPQNFHTVNLPNCTSKI